MRFFPKHSEKCGFLRAEGQSGTENRERESGAGGEKFSWNRLFTHALEADEAIIRDEYPPPRSRGWNRIRGQQEYQ